MWNSGKRKKKAGTKRIEWVTSFTVTIIFILTFIFRTLEKVDLELCF